MTFFWIGSGSNPKWVTWLFLAKRTTGNHLTQISFWWVHLANMLSKDESSVAKATFWFFLPPRYSLRDLWAAPSISSLWKHNRKFKKRREFLNILKIQCISQVKDRVVNDGALRWSTELLGTPIGALVSFLSWLSPFECLMLTFQFVDQFLEFNHLWRGQPVVARYFLALYVVGAFPKYVWFKQQNLIGNFYILKNSH